LRRRRADFDNLLIFSTIPSPQRRGARGEVGFSQRRGARGEVGFQKRKST